MAFGPTPNPANSHRPSIESPSDNARSPLINSTAGATPDALRPAPLHHSSLFKMAPSAVDEPMLPPPDTRTYPPAHVFPVKETKFEKFVEPQPDGRRRALEQPDGAAIVIDNGEHALRPRLTRLRYRPVAMQF